MTAATLDVLPARVRRRPRRSDALLPAALLAELLAGLLAGAAWRSELLTPDPPPLPVVVSAPAAVRLPAVGGPPAPPAPPRPVVARHAPRDPFAAQG